MLVRNRTTPSEGDRLETFPPQATHRNLPEKNLLERNRFIMLNCEIKKVSLCLVWKRLWKHSNPWSRR